VPAKEEAARAEGFDPSELPFSERRALFQRASLEWRLLSTTVIRASSVNELWLVTGGAKAGSIIVRSSCGLEPKLSNFIGRLASGARVREVERTECRLHYVKVAGAGPDAGWVSLFSRRGTPLLTKAA